MAGRARCRVQQARAPFYAARRNHTHRRRIQRVRNLTLPPARSKIIQQMDAVRGRLGLKSTHAGNNDKSQRKARHQQTERTHREKDSTHAAILPALLITLCNSEYAAGDGALLLWRNPFPRVPK